MRNEMLVLNRTAKMMWIILHTLSLNCPRRISQRIQVETDTDPVTGKVQPRQPMTVSDRVPLEIGISLGVVKKRGGGVHEHRYLKSSCISI
jgi:hypothetical protein